MSATRAMIFLKNTTVNFIAQIIDKALSFVLAIVVARYLGPADFGKYSFCFAFISLFAIVSNMGLDVLIVREVAQDKSRASLYLGNAIVMKGIFSALMFGLICAVINIMGVPLDKRLGVYLGGLYLVSIAIGDLFAAFFTAHEKMEFTGLVIIVEKVVTVIAAFSALFLRHGYLAIIFAFFLGGLAKIIFASMMLFKKFERPQFNMEFALWKRLFMAALPIGLSQLFFGIYFKVDAVLLSVFKGDDAVGWYSAAYGLVYSLRFIPRPVYGAAFPLISQLYTSSLDKTKKVYRIILKYLFITSIPFAIFASVLAKELILFFFKNQFAESIMVLKILAWVIPFMFLSYLFNMTLIVLDRQRVIGYLYGFITALNIALNILLIPRLAHVGAAIALIISEAFCFMLPFVYLNRVFYRAGAVDTFLKPLAAGLLAMLALLALNKITVFVSIPVSLCIYLGALIVTKTFGDEEKVLLKGLIGGMTKEEAI